MDPKAALAPAIRAALVLAALAAAYNIRLIAVANYGRVIRLTLAARASSRPAAGWPTIPARLLQSVAHRLRPAGLG